jgi:hypothetical protein
MSALARALQALPTSAQPDPARLAACWAAIDRELTAGFSRVEALLASGKRADAQRALADIDRRFGGLAAPHSLELAGQ